MEAVAARAIEEHALGLPAVLARSRKLLARVKRLCSVKANRCAVLRELTDAWRGASGPAAVVAKLREDRQRRLPPGALMRPFEEARELARLRAMHVLLLHRCDERVRAFTAASKARALAQKQVAQCEGLNYFLLEEEAFARHYLDNVAELDENRFRLKHHLSTKSGFIKSEFMQDQGDFMEAGFLLGQLERALERCTDSLAQLHGDLQRGLAKERVAAALALQAFVRLRSQRVVAYGFERRWRARVAKRVASLAAYARRKGMQREDVLGARMQLEDRAARAMQRAARIFLAEVRRQVAAQGFFRSQQAQDAREADARVKKKLREEIESARRLGEWRCPRCQQLKIPHKPRAFRTWADVEAHLEAHGELRALRRERNTRIAERLEEKVAKEKVFIRQARLTRTTRERERLGLALVDADWVARAGSPRPDQVGMSVLAKAEADAARPAGCPRRFMIPLADGVTRLGRSRTKADVRLDSVALPHLVSKVHCAVAVVREVRGDPDQDGATVHLHATVEDCGSTNGTSVGGASLAPRQPVPLALGDELRIGHCPHNAERAALADLRYVLLRTDSLA